MIQVENHNLNFRNPTREQCLPKDFDDAFILNLYP